MHFFRGSPYRPARDVMLRLHIMQLFHVCVHPLLNKRRVSGVHFQVNPPDIHQKKDTNLIKRWDGIIRWYHDIITMV